MRKLALFVEGHTEVLFVEKLIFEIAGAHKVAVQHQQVLGGATVLRRMHVIRAASVTADTKYYVLIVDCGGDHQVKPRIIEEHGHLTQAGYSKIIGLRDVRPNVAYADIPNLERNLRTYIKTALIPVEFVLAVMEIEAWFLAEYLHFPKIHPAISVEAIKTALGFDPTVDDLALRANPSADIELAYNIGGQRYQKPSSSTIVNLDYAHIYTELAQKIPHMKKLVDGIDAFLS